MIEKIKSLFYKYREQIMYLIFGGLTTAVNWVIYFPLTNWLGVHYQIANVIAWIAAVLFAFVTNKILVFGSRSRSAAVVLPELVKFFGARVISLLTEMGIMWLFVDVAGIGENIMKVVTAVIVVIMNYVFSKLFIFRGKS